MPVFIHYGVWRELLDQADPEVRAVHRKVFAATFCSSYSLLFEEKLYLHPHVVSDITRFPAAAIAAARVKWMSLNVPWVWERNSPASADRLQSG